MQCLVLNYLDSESVQAALVLSQLYVVELYDKLQGSDPSRIMMRGLRILMILSKVRVTNQSSICIYMTGHYLAIFPLH